VSVSSSWMGRLKKIVLFGTVIGCRAAAADAPKNFPESAGSERAAVATVQIAKSDSDSLKCRILSSTGDADADKSACYAANPRALAKPQTLPVWIIPPRPVDFVSASSKVGENMIRISDYPERSLQKNEQGRVVIRYVITESGKVENCNVIESSGFKALDEVSCRVAIQRFSFDPATIAGTPVRSVRIHNIIYSLPGSI
jgi:TonB family protein